MSDVFWPLKTVFFCFWYWLGNIFAASSDKNIQVTSSGLGKGKC